MQGRMGLGSRALWLMTSDKEIESILWNHRKKLNAVARQKHKYSLGSFARFVSCVWMFEIYEII